MPAGVRTRPLILVLLALPLVPLLRPVRARAQDADPPEVAIGERLFLETRFAQYFAKANGKDVNAPLAQGDPAVEQVPTTGAPLPGPFAGQSINCRSCHFVDEELAVPGGGMRTYSDFAFRSPTPARKDGRAFTTRNAPALVSATLPRAGGLLLHFDGEFDSTEDLVRGTLTGRNFGWLPKEQRKAVRHVAQVIRGDDGSGELAQETGGAYSLVLAGTDPTIPPDFVLPEAFRIDVKMASDDEILDVVAKLITAYVEQLIFSQDEDGKFNGSPFDRFLEANGLPHQPDPGEDARVFSRRLGALLNALASPVYVDEGPFQFHDQSFAFGAEELAGARIFFAPAVPGETQKSGVGNCTACHAAPLYTDFGFHNTGVSQREFDRAHSEGDFAALAIPSLQQRTKRPSRWLPATAKHPKAKESFRAAPAADRPQAADLGLWNVFANADMPAPQEKIWEILCRAVLDDARAATPDLYTRCSPEALLPLAVARFKTPGLRDLGHSQPYLHDGSAATLEDVVSFYRDSAHLARAGTLRNGDPELGGIVLGDEDTAPLAAFLRALNEDYN